MIGRAISAKTCVPVIVFILFSVTTIAEVNNIEDGLQNCRFIPESGERLQCFDDMALQFAPANYSGKLGHVTELFKLEVPHKLRFRSHGVIFVLYLRDQEGNVLQNLHIGGQGEDEYLIEEPGEYSLKIDGSAAWDIWLEPIKEELP